MGNPIQTASPRGRRARWLLLIALAIIVTATVLGDRVGSCVDYAPSSGLAGTCTTEPAIGVPGAWLVGLLGAGTVVYALVRLIRRP